MFKRLQLKMTLFFTLILIGIMLITNASIYFILSTYNNYQLSKEIEEMLLSIQGSEWVQETRTDNSLEEHFLENEKTNDDEDDDNDEIDEYPYEISIPSIEDLIIPSILTDFSFYYIYNNDDEIIRRSNNNPQLSELITERNKTIVLGETPVVVNFSSAKDIYYLMMRMPIIIENQQYGSYCVGKDVSVAYETLSNLLRIILLSLIIGIMVSLLLGYLIAGHTIKPIKGAYEAKVRFIADASHELRTPISVILLSSETLEREIQHTESFQHQIVSDIKDEALKVGGLVEKLLFLARNDSSGIVTNRETFDISEIIKKNVNSYNYMAEAKEIMLKNNISQRLEVIGDQKMLSTVISIIIDNAIKYTPAEGKINLSGSRKSVKSKDYVAIAIEDTGMGIKRDDYDKIFERFYRLESSRSKKTGGYGLGLAIAKEIIEDHKGFIEISSQVGIGTCFTIFIPS